MTFVFRCGAETADGTLCQHPVSVQGQRCAQHSRARRFSPWAGQAAPVPTVEIPDSPLPAEVLSPPEPAAPTAPAASATQVENPAPAFSGPTIETGRPEVETGWLAWVRRASRAFMPPLCEGMRPDGTPCHNRVDAVGEICAGCWLEWMTHASDPLATGSDVHWEALSLARHPDFPLNRLPELIERVPPSQRALVMGSALHRSPLPERYWAMLATANSLDPDILVVQKAAVQVPHCPPQWRQRIFERLWQNPDPSTRQFVRHWAPRLLAVG